MTKVQNTRVRTISVHVEGLLQGMTLADKLGQLNQKSMPDDLNDILHDIEAGRIGSVINVVDPKQIQALQECARNKSPLGIPLLIGRDVIHGFESIMPIPLAQAASWDPEIVASGARVAAQEASEVGINWTFAPMIDVSRDPRWGRIAESFGEDPYLTSVLGEAMVRGFQGESLAAADSIMACAKHFAGYGASESGRDYNTTNIPFNELHNIYLPPFLKAVQSGVASVMCSFSDLDGTPATANEYLMQNILKQDWAFSGLVVSDWCSISELMEHGIAENTKDCAQLAAKAGIDVEMQSGCYVEHFKTLLDEGVLDIERVDDMVRRILNQKFKLGLFEHKAPQVDKIISRDQKCALALKAAEQSMVLLKNEAQCLPLEQSKGQHILLTGPLANAPYEQLGTWIFDGNPNLSVTPAQAFEHANIKHRFIQGLSHSRAKEIQDEKRLLAEANAADVIIMVAGEEAILSGEAHSRARLNLPGEQGRMIDLLSQAQAKLILVIMAGRPLCVENLLPKVDALLYAWHPGMMAGEALRNLVFGLAVPSAKLPVSFPVSEGQIPIYYNHKNTGRPPTAENVVHMNDIEEFAAQTSVGMSSYHLDDGYQPLFPFGYGLSYTQFEYQDMELLSTQIDSDSELEFSVTLINTGSYKATEIVQYYVRDLVASISRPVKELKGFRRVTLEVGEQQRLNFKLPASRLGFYRYPEGYRIESGRFRLWVGGSSTAELSHDFYIV